MKARFFLVLAASLTACSGAAELELFAPGPSSDAKTIPAGNDSSIQPQPVADAAADHEPEPDSGGALKPDAGTWKSPGVFCGEAKGSATYCQAHSETCCATLDLGLEFQFECQAASASSCKSGRSLKCDDRSDCPGSQVCCATYEVGFGYESSECRTSCTSPGGDAGSSIRLCDLRAPEDECKSIGQKCRPSESLEGFGLCE